MLVTLSLVGWWWVHALQGAAGDDRMRRMFFWEGGFLLGILTLGGVVLVYLTFHHQARHERLKTFFSIFAHDLKTSMSRLRLQADLLEEKSAGRDPRLAAILKDIRRLDLQLENSLWMSQLESGPLLLQKTRLRDVMDHLRNEFGEVRFELSRDAEVLVDRRVFTVVLRNLFHNSVLHGKADRIDISLIESGSEAVLLEIGDNGQSGKMPPAHVGREILSNRGRDSNGLGLYLSRRLVARMNGRLDFSTKGRFLNLLSLKGRLA